MKTIQELIAAFFSSASVVESAEIAYGSGLEGAKDAFMAIYKSQGKKAKELNEIWKAVEEKLGAKKTKAGGFTEYYYDWLASESHTEQEAYDFLMGENTSDNTKKHLTLYLNIWALAESIHRGVKVVRTMGEKAAPKAKKSAEKVPEWEYDQSKPYADVKSAWETLKREIAKARPNANKFHPDRVTFLNDEALTHEYTEAFKKYNRSKRA